MTPHSIETLRHLAPGAKAELRALAQAVSLSDQAQALIANAAKEVSAQDVASTPEQSDGLFILARDETGQLRAAGVVDLRLDPPVAEFIADPEADNQVDWIQLVFDELANNPPTPSIVTWDHGADTAIGQLAQARGWPISRSLVIMESPLDEQVAHPSHAHDHSQASEQPPVPDGCQLRPFNPDTDETAWLELNRNAFVDLPDQAAWTLDDLRARYDEPWFDPDGFLVLANSSGKLLGAHWTKREGDDGEVYVLAVAPDSAGQGLGALLTHAGLNHLASSGATKVHLYVDATNTKALALYRKLGFAELARDTQYLAGLGHV